MVDMGNDGVPATIPKSTPTVLSVPSFDLVERPQTEAGAPSIGSMDDQRGRRGLGEDIYDADAAQEGLFHSILDHLAKTDAFSHPTSPSVFVVYAHDNAGQGRADSAFVKLLIEWLGVVRSRTLSDKRPLPLFSPRAEDSIRNIVSNQACLLPGDSGPPETGEIVRVDKVVVCASEVLKRYFEHQFTSAYVDGINAIYDGNETWQRQAPSLFEEIQEFVEAHSQSDGFHHVLTELAILKIRSRFVKPHGLIPTTLNGTRTDFSRLFQEIGIRPSDLVIDLESAARGDLHRMFFKLLKQIYVEQHSLIDCFKECYSRGSAAFRNGFRATKTHVEPVFALEISKAQARYSEIQSALIRDGCARMCAGRVDEHVLQVLQRLKKSEDVLGAVLQIVKDRRVECRRKRWKITNPRGDAIVLCDQMEMIIHWIDKYKSIGYAAVQSHVANAELPWAAVRFLFQATVKSEEVFEALSGSLETAVRLITRHRIAKELLTRSSCPDDQRQELEAALGGLYREILTFLAKAVKYFKTPKLRRTPRSPFEAMESFEIHKAVEKDREVSRLSSRMSSQETAIDDGKLNQLRQLVQGLEASVVRMAIQEEHSMRTLKEAQHRDLLHWLSTVEYSRHHRSHSRNRLAGTCAWLLNHAGYISWRSSSSPSIMILHGVLGCGKTTVSSWVIDSFLQPPHGTRGGSEAVAPMAYFYCSNTISEPERRDPTTILRTVVRQIAVTTSPTQTSPSLLRAYPYVVSQYEKRLAQSKLDGFDLERLSSRECIDIISLVAEKEPVTIVIDALDELQDDESLSDLVLGLDEVVRRAANVVKIFLTSRSEGRLFSLLPQAIKVRISKSNNAADVAAFTRWQIGKAIGDHRLLGGEVTVAIRAELNKTLVHQAGEMFWWVKLQLNRICSMKTEKDVQDAMRHLPTELQTVYHSILEQILRGQHGQHASKLAQHALSWLLHGRRSLSPEGFLRAVSISVDHTQGRLTPDITASMIESFCLNLVCLDPISNMFRLAHPSIQEFLLSRPEFAEAEFHGVMAGACIYACSRLLPLAGEVGMDEASLTSGLTFPDYATIHWAQHYHLAGERGSEELRSQMISFVLGDSGGAESSGAFLVWLEHTRSLSRHLPKADPMFRRLSALTSPDDTPLFTAAEFGLMDLLENFNIGPATRYDWNRRNDLHNTALYLASVSGHANIAEYLLKQGADIDLEGGRHGPPAHAAAFYGHERACRLLLKNGADSRRAGNLCGEASSNVVEAALAGGHEEFAQWLLTEVEHTLSAEAFGLIMEEACKGGYVHIVEWLELHYLGKVAPLPVQAAITQAIRSGQIGVLQLLLRRHQKLVDPLPTNAIALAALHGQEAVIAFCLERGSDIDHPGQFGSPLRVASLMGHDRVVRFLLERGAKTSSDQPLQAAALRGHVEIVNTLIYVGGLSANEDAKEYENPLTAAAYKGHEEVARALLDAGADPFRSSGPASKYVNAFHAAIEGNNNTILDIFHEKGFTFKVVPDMGLTDFVVASRGENMTSDFDKLDLTQSAPRIHMVDDLSRRLDQESCLAPRKHATGCYQSRGSRDGPGLVRVRYYLDQVKSLLCQLRVTGDGLDQLIGFFVRAVEGGNLEIVRLIAPEIRDLLVIASMDDDLNRSKWMFHTEGLGLRIDSWKPLAAAASSGHIDVAEYLLSLQDSGTVISLTEMKELLSDCSNMSPQAFSKALAYLENLCEAENHHRREAAELLQHSMQTVAGLDNPELLAFILGSQGVMLQESFPESIHQAWDLGYGHAPPLSALWNLPPTGGEAHMVKCLMTAAEHDRYQNVRLLMSMGYRVPDSVPLVTCVEGHVGLASFLLNKMKLSPERRSRILVKGLILASQNGHIDVAKLMIREGADVNALVEYDALQQLPSIEDIGELRERIIIGPTGDLKDRIAPISTRGTVTALGACVVGFARFDLQDEALCNLDWAYALQEWHERTPEPRSQPKLVRKGRDWPVDHHSGRDEWQTDDDPDSDEWQTDDDPDSDEWQTDDDPDSDIMEDLTPLDRHEWAKKAAPGCEQLEVLKALLDSGADVNLPGTGSFSSHPLLMAVRWCKPEVVRLIVERTDPIRLGTLKDELTTAVVGRRCSNLEVARALVYCIEPRASQCSDDSAVVGMLSNLSLEFCIGEVLRRARPFASAYGNKGVVFCTANLITKEWLSQPRGPFGPSFAHIQLSSAFDNGPGALLRVLLSTRLGELEDADQAMLLLLAALVGSPEWVTLLSRCRPKPFRNTEGYWWHWSYNLLPQDLSPLEAASHWGKLEFLTALLPIVGYIYSSLGAIRVRLGKSLHAAIATKHSEVAAALVQCAMRLQISRSAFNGSHLLHATNKQLPNVVDLLLQAGVDANAIGRPRGIDFEAPALYYACDSAASTIPHMLLAAGADATWLPPETLAHHPPWSSLWWGPEPSGPLHVACASGNAAVARALIEHGADPWAGSGLGTPLCCAARGGSLGCVRLLLETLYDSDDDHEQDLGKGLDEAVDARASEVAVELLSWGAPVFSVGVVSGEGKPRNALARLIGSCQDATPAGGRTGMVTTAKALLAALENMDDPEALFEDYAKISPLQLDPLQESAFRAIECGNVEFFELLSEFLPTEALWFHGACALGSVSVVQRMLGKSIDVDVAGQQNLHALHVAASHLHCDVVEILVTSGADLNYRCGSPGVTPLMAAMEGCLKEDRGHRPVQDCFQDYTIAKRLLTQGDHPSRTSNPLSAPASLLQILRVLLKYGAGANPQHGLFGTPLQIACYLKSDAIVQLLLDHGADVNRSGGCLKSPLVVALFSGFDGETRGIIARLLEKGADISSNTGEGSSPLISACKRRSISSIRMLLEHGADVNEGDGALLEKALAVSPAMTWAVLRYGVGLRVREKHMEILKRQPETKYLGKTRLEWLIRYRSQHPEHWDVCPRSRTRQSKY